MAWVFLMLAGAFEIAFTTAMRFTNGFTKIWPSLLVLLLAAISIYFVAKASELIPLGTAYAAWGGIGAIGTVAIGILYFDEPVTLWRMVFLSTLIISIAGLKLVTE
ncbi:multidrug efflux SMR transporter [Hyphomicrobium sp.]|uniref:DMT family transporter n=1 Tax=Hyphomicrobium sp. TaxID=82 RepID=UPI0025C6DF2F|nr:multidrug efflux SMR transporter [Hyphomicrobium sp.]MCC7252813.1 multidrug efflux SMR transporter [Hyphomicrobium sp.]